MTIAVWKRLFVRLSGAKSRPEQHDPAPIAPAMMPRDLAAESRISR